jgi:hypothetical protein
MERICIYPKDIQIVTGRSERYGREVIRKIKQANGKQSHQLVTIEEFCHYLGLQLDSVLQRLKVYN